MRISRDLFYGLVNKEIRCCHDHYGPNKEEKEDASYESNIAWFGRSPANRAKRARSLRSVGRPSSQRECAPKQGKHPQSNDNETEFSLNGKRGYGVSYYSSALDGESGVMQNDTE